MVVDREDGGFMIFFFFLICLWFSFLPAFEPSPLYTYHEKSYSGTVWGEEL